MPRRPLLNNLEVPSPQSHLYQTSLLHRLAWQLGIFLPTMNNIKLEPSFMHQRRLSKKGSLTDWTGKNRYSYHSFTLGLASISLTSRSEPTVAGSNFNCFLGVAVSEMRNVDSSALKLNWSIQTDFARLHRMSWNFELHENIIVKKKEQVTLRHASTSLHQAKRTLNYGLK